METRTTLVSHTTYRYDFLASTTTGKLRVTTMRLEITIEIYLEMAALCCSLC